MKDATLLLQSIARGEAQAAEDLLGLVYDELRRLAAHRMAMEAPAQTLQPTALVHEAWLRLTGGNPVAINDRSHFFSLAAEAMRRILIDRARRKRALRHGGRHQRVELDGCDIAAPDADDRMLAVHEALDTLARQYPLQAELVKLRYFAGMTNEESAKILGISVSTAKNYWTFARTWLFHAITRE